MDLLRLSKKYVSGLVIFMALSSNNSSAVVTLLEPPSQLNARADMITLDFEGIGNKAEVSDFYNGGTDGVGSFGADHGIYFSNAAVGIIDVDVDINIFSGNFANEPSGSTALIFLEGGDAIMNVRDGFESAFSFFYSSAKPVSVNVYDGLDGTGNLLASSTLKTNYKDNNCTGDIFGDWCNWDHVGVTFKGKAMSVVFDGPRAFTFYDNFTLGGKAPGSNYAPGNPPDRDLMSECKKDIMWHRRNRRMVDNSSDHIALHSECKQFRWYRQWHRKNRQSLSLKRG